MQTFTPEFQAELDKGQTEPWVLVDGYEFYSADYIPGPDGFDPADAIECFAGQELTWNGVAYRREVISRGDIVLNVGEKTNSVSITFSNISRYLATFAQSQTIEGMLLCIRCIAPAVTNDSKAMFHGRCDKPGDIDKKSFPLTARQDYGHLNQQAPPSKFTADDPEGRLPSDPLFEGFPFFSVQGSYAFPYVRQSNGLLGRLFGRRTTDRRSEQWSSVTDTPYGSPIPEVFGRCQMPLIPVAAVDKGIYIGGMWVACKGPIAAIENVKTQQAGVSDPLCTFTPTPAAIHLGDAGGTGTNLGNTCQADLGGGLKYSFTAYVDGAVIVNEWFQDQTISDPNLLNELPLVTALILGRVVPLPDSDGEYTEEGWTDNPAHIARFILTNSGFCNINPGFMEDAGIYRTALHCDEPLIDESESQHIAITTPDINQAGVSFTRYRSTGLINPRSILYNDLGDDSIIPELQEGPYLAIDLDGGPDDVFCPVGQHRDPESGLCVDDLPTLVPMPNASQPLLRKRYTTNFPITEEIRVVDLIYKILFPAARLYMVVTGKGKLDIRSERPASATRIRSATAVGAMAIPVLDVTPWKSGPELLTGRIVLNESQLNSETRTVASADYSTSGNSITLTASDTGGVTATASGATLSGGSTTVQASGTVTIGGSPAPGDTVTITIDGIAIGYILGSDDTTGTTAAMLASYINATKRISYYIQAIWDSASPTVVTIKCLHGALNVDTALLKAHTGPIADPTTAPTIAAAAGTLQAGTYLVAYADQTTIGLTALTLIASVVLTVNQQINVSSLPAFPAGVTGRQFFVSDAPNSSRLRYLTTRVNASDFSINSLPLPGAAVPPSYNSTSEELIRVAMSFATNSQDVFKPWSASTTLAIIGNATDDTYLPTVPNGHKYQLTTAGTTGSSEPSWPTGAGATVASGSAVFTEIGSTVLQQAGLTRANIVKDTFKWPLGGMQSSVNVIEIPFRDAKNDFALTTLRIHDPVHQAQVKKKFALKIDGSAIDNFNQAYRVGNSELSKNREGDWFDALEGSPACLVLEEGDLIAASDDSGGLVNVITRIEELRIKPDHNVAITKARKYSTAMHSDDVGSHVIPIASTLRYVQTKDSIVEFIDSPPLRDADGLTPGFYVAVSHDLTVDGDWRGWELYADYGDGYKLIAKGDVAATLGECTTTLGTVTDPSVWDRVNSVTFTLDYEEPSGSFETVTEQELLSNSRRNLFLIGNEYVQAATVVDNGNRSYTISTLLRARFGSEGSNLANLTHGASERVVFINGAEVLVEINPTRLNGAFNYKAKTTNQDLADVIPVSFTWTGGTVKPLAPVNLRGSRNSTGDLLIEWDRRSRFGPGLTSQTGTSLGEEQEHYIVEIYSGSTLKRTIHSFGGVQDVIWRSNDPAASISGGTFTHTKPAGSLESVIATVIQQMLRDSSFFEHTIEIGGGVAIVTDVAVIWPSEYPRYTIRVNAPSSGIEIYEGVRGDGFIGSSLVADTGPFTHSNGDRVRAVTTGSELKFYLNYTGEGSVPFYVSTKAVEFPLRLEGKVYPAPAGANPQIKTAVIFTGGPGTVYSSLLQVEDFGSTQSSIKVRVMQISSLVGAGPYVEKLL